MAATKKKPAKSAAATPNVRNYTSVYLDDDTRDRLALLAKKSGKSRSQVIVSLIHQAEEDDFKGQVTDLVAKLATVVGVSGR
jgi:predicted transcriptional regulator